MDSLLQFNVRKHGSSALGWAVEHDHLKMGERMVGFGANVLARHIPNIKCSAVKITQARYSPLHYAIYAGNEKMVDVLLKAMMRTTGVEPRKEKSLLALALYTKQERIARILIKRLDNIDEPLEPNNQTALYLWIR